MKKIALIMDSWKRYFTYAWPAGILQRINETKEDVNLYIFNSSGNWNQDDAYNVGEYNIYRLPDLSKFDGIVLDLNNISSPQMLEEVAAKSRDTGVPVISIANEIEDFYYVGIDNYAAMKEMIAHLHEHHGCRRYWFIMGSKENYENRRRTAALWDYIREQRLSCSEEDFYFESFQFQCGKQGFEHLLAAHGGELPDAVICANDNIAVGVCEAAAAHGYRAPRDFCVTGFDDFDKARYYVPRISTMAHIREEVGYQCADVLLRLWAGETVPRFTYTHTKGVFWESCGCEDKEGLDDRQHLKDQIMYDIDSRAFDEKVLELTCELQKCSTVEEMMTCIPRTIPSLRCDAMYLVLDEHMDFYKKQREFYHNPGKPLTADNFCTEGYPNRMRVKFAYEEGRIIERKNELLQDIFPQFEYPEGGKDFLFIPLHFREYTVGYFVIRNAVYLLEKQYLFQVMNALNTALENLHKNEKLEYMNQALSQLYVKDSMTGMYNRMGYQKLAAGFLDKIHQEGGSALVLFVDLDCLKEINDTLGHEYGDFAIIAAAKVIMKYCGSDAMSFRNGGDEFVIIRCMVSQEETEAFVKNIRSELDLVSRQMDFPFRLGVSIGTAVSDPASGRKLADYVREADERMYLEKLRKKVNRK